MQLCFTKVDSEWSIGDICASPGSTDSINKKLDQKLVKGAHSSVLSTLGVLQLQVHDKKMNIAI